MKQSYFARGNQLFQEQRYEEAVEAYRKAIQQNPRFYCYYHNLGEALLKMGKKNDALDAFDQVITIKPDLKWSLPKVVAPKVSIITSVFNGDRYIKHFLKDITRQTVFDECELILINPNSPGNEEPIIQEYMRRFPNNIVYVSLDEDPGLYETWNLAIRMARGEYITNANLDDRRAPHHIEKLLGELETDASIDVACTAVLVTQSINETWEDNTAYTTWYSHYDREKEEYSGLEDFFQSECQKGIKTEKIVPYNFPHCMPIWRKCLHDDNGYFDEKTYGTSADWEFWLRCASNRAKFKLVQESLGLYLEDPKSHNRTYENKENLEKKIFEKYYKKLLRENSITTIELSSTNEQNSVEEFQCPRKINLNNALSSCFGNHRSGWIWTMRLLAPLHNDLGVWLDAFIEKKFCWGNDPGDKKNNPQPYKAPWIGFIHVPPGIPEWFQYEQSPQSIFASGLWKESVENCLGLFCLSEYYKSWLEQHLDIPIENLIHPTETPELKFSMDAFLANRDRKIVQIGWWLRKLHSIYFIPPKKNIKKALLCLDEPHIDRMFAIERKIYNLQPDESVVEKINRLPDSEYDLLLSKNIVYIDLYDTSANNIVIECIVRNTPVLVNPLPAVVEYLGEDYPFYFNNPNEAALKSDDFSLIEQTHNYLLNHHLKKKLSAEYFLKSFTESVIYRNL